ncbi:hypothetical protein OX462_02395 [Janthinobacterium sp. SUN098]|uniref:hypothetical protein n=1 Tax=Janthinobacterium sp. SUN098 TaxID=3002437 RepID=UPI0038D461C1
MAKIQNFLKSGELGPVVLSSSPTDVLDECGTPHETSRKLNPLILRYGEIQLTFLRTPVAKSPRLHEIQISMRPESKGSDRTNAPSSPLFLEDITLWRATTRPEFMTLARKSGCSLIGEGSSQVVFASGVIASFENGVLDSLRLSNKESTQRPPQKILDEREPNLAQIRDMLEESYKANSVGARRAAMLILWAALEAILRRAALSRGSAGRSSVAPHSLIRELAASGFLSPSQMRLLEEARQIRMADAHGLAPISHPPMLMQELADLTNYLLSRTEIH